MNSPIFNVEVGRFKFLMEHKPGSLVNETTTNKLKSKNIFLENNTFETPILEEGYNFNSQFIEEGYNFDTVFLEEGYNEEDDSLIYEKQIRYYLQKIDEELSKLERLHLAQVIHESKFIYKLQIVESIKKGYNALFRRYKNEEVLLEYKKNFSGKLILESTYNATEEVSKYYSFIKKSLLYEFELISREEYDMVLTENWFTDKLSSAADAVGGAVSSAGNWVADKTKAVKDWTVDKAQKVAKAYKEGGGGLSGVLNVAGKTTKYVANKVADAWNWLKTKGMDFIMEGIRSFLNSGVGAVATQILDYTGIGAIGVTAVWAIMTIWDFYKVTVGGGSWFKVIFSVIGLLTAGALGKVVGTWLKPMFGKGSSLDGVLKWIKDQSWFGKYILPWIKKLVSGLSTVGGWISKAVKWFISKFPGAKWVSGVGNKLIGWLEGLASKFAAWAGAGSKGVTTQAGKQYAQKQAGKQIVKKLVKDPLEDLGKEAYAGAAGLVGGEKAKAAVEYGQAITGYDENLGKMQKNIKSVQVGRLTPGTSLSKDLLKNTGKVVKDTVKGAQSVTPQVNTATKTT